MKERIIKLFKKVINRLPRYYKRDLVIFHTTESMLEAYAKDIESSLEDVTAWYINNYWNRIGIEASDLYTQPTSLENIPTITTSEYMMVSTGALKEKGNKEITYLFLRELGESYYATKHKMPAPEEKIKTFAKRWFNTLKKEGEFDER